MKLTNRFVLAAALTALSASVCLSLEAGTAHGYALSGAKWMSRALPVKFKVDYASSRELGQATTQQVVEASFSAWSGQSCSAFRWTNLGAITSGSADANDNQNVLVWRYTSWPRELGGSSTIGVTTPVYYPGSGGSQGQMIDADIQFNGIDYRWVTNPTRSNHVDSQSIITHEVGHFLGLDHSGNSSATMYASYVGGTGSRSLHSDDIGGVCALYPSATGTECSMTRACPAGKLCQNGYCVDAPPPVGELGADCSGEAQCGENLYCVCTDQAQTQCFCTRDCSDAAPCPSSWTCAPLEGGGGACITGSSGGTGMFGDNCSSGEDCANGYCVGTTGTSGKCSQPCSTTDSSTCPNGYRCAGLQGGGGACIASTVNPPRDGGTTASDGGTTTSTDPRELGEGCAGTFECRSNFCAYKTQQERVCSRPCGSNDDCPESFECRPSATGTLFCFGGEGGPVGGEDAGTTEPIDDAGTTTQPPGGGCSATGQVDLTWLLFAAAALAPLLARRRRRRP